MVDSEPPRAYLYEHGEIRHPVALELSNVPRLNLGASVTRRRWRVNTAAIESAAMGSTRFTGAAAALGCSGSKPEVDMHLLIVCASAALIVTVPGIGVPRAQIAAAAECTGENCPPPSGQGSGHDCHRKRQEQTTS
jgi:hypothetical protein